MMSIGLADGIIGFVIVGSTIYSLVRGFIRELFLIIAILLGLIVATKFYPAVKDLLLSWIHNPTISTVMGFLLLFFLVAVLLVIVGNVASKLIHFVKMGFLDRLLGGALGVFKGVLICGIGCMIILAFIPQGEDLLKDSTLAPGILSLTSKFFCLFPKDVKEKFEEKLKNLNPPREMAIRGISIVIR